MEEHQEDSQHEQMDADEASVSSYEGNVQIDDSQDALSAEEEEEDEEEEEAEEEEAEEEEDENTNSILADDVVEGEAAPPAIDESNDSSDDEVPIDDENDITETSATVPEGSGDAVTTEEAEADVDETSSSPHSVLDDGDANETAATSAVDESDPAEAADIDLNLSAEKEEDEQNVPDGGDTMLDLTEADEREVNNASPEEEATTVETSHDESDFLGFDAQTIETSAEKTSELMQTFNHKKEELTRTIVAPNEGEGDAIPSSVTNDAAATDAVVVVKEETPVANAVGDQPSSNHIDAQSSAEETAAAVAASAEALLKNSRKPNPVHSVLGVPVNIFDETLPSGSKRVKKKRKFFGDFEETDAEKAPRKSSSSSRPNEEGVKLLNNISGENKENFITDEKLKVDAAAEADSTNQNKVKRTNAFDISNPAFKEPFKYGWKREICYRNLPEGSKSKPAYVGYYSPAGKKFKTIRQIVEAMPSDSVLKEQHFTFSVQRIFNEPSEFEILREAKSRTDTHDAAESVNNSYEATAPNLSIAQSTPSDPVKYASKKKITATSTPGSRLVIKKPKYLRPADSEDDGVESLLMLSSAPSSTTPKIVIKGASLSSAKANSSKSKSNSMKKDKKQNNKKEKSYKKGLISMEHNSMNSSTHDISKNTIDSSAFCSYSCPLALGSAPTLECTACLSLYHFECCGFDASQPVHGYVCKSCRSPADFQSKLLLAVSQSSSSTLGYGGSNAVISGSRTSTTAKIVDGVTTWLPHSSNVQLSSRHAATSSPALSTASEATHATLLQSVLELDGRRYIIVPKESIVSISPNTNSVVNTYAEERQSEAREATVSIRAAETARNWEGDSSAGVLLVPVMPSGSNEPYCNQIERGSSKRKLSDDMDAATMAKMARLDGERPSYQSYRSALTLTNITQLYDPLTFCFKFLTVRDLLRVSMSCKYLNRIASEPSLWKTVRLKNSKVRDWEGFARTLRKYGTKKLDLRKMLCPSQAGDVNAMWSNFLEKIPSVTSLQHIEFSRCNAHVAETVARTCPNLVVINAVQLRNGDGLSMESFTKLKYLRELRLKGSNGLSVQEKTPSDETDLPSPRLDFLSKETMRVLSLTSIKNLNSSVVGAIGDLSNLNILELGECNGEFPGLMDELTASLAKLHCLQRLRLEQITNLDPEYKLFESVKSLPQLKSLELVNIEIRAGFCETITACSNIENLLIIPLYKTESATSNRLIMDCLPPLSTSLKSFVWGLTHELIRATGLYATQYLEKPNGGNADETKTSPLKGPDSIPIVKRISKHPEVDILSVRNLEKMLAIALPQTRIKVITVAFASTTRQNLSDSLK